MNGLQYAQGEIAERPWYIVNTAGYAMGERDITSSKSDYQTMSLEDRERLARELHDGPIQMLTIVALQVGMCQRAARRGDTEALNEGLNQLASAVQRGVDDFRRVVSALRRPTLSGQRLTDTLACYVQDCHAHMDLDTLLDPSGLAYLDWLPDRQQMAVLHVVQEAMQNAYEHASASRVHIGFQLRPATLEVLIEDDGCGFDADHVLGSESGHVGLACMREWAEQAGGTLRVESRSGQGCRVILTVPFVNY